METKKNKKTKKKWRTENKIEAVKKIIFCKNVHNYKNMTYIPTYVCIHIHTCTMHCCGALHNLKVYALFQFRWELVYESVFECRYTCMYVYKMAQWVRVSVTQPVSQSVCHCLFLLIEKVQPKNFYALIFCVFYFTVLAYFSSFFSFSLLRGRGWSER